MQPGIVQIAVLVNLGSDKESYKADLRDLYAPRFKIRHTDRNWYFPLHFENNPETLDEVILLGLHCITGNPPTSPEVAGHWMLFAKDLHIGSIVDLAHLPRGAELVLVGKKAVLVDQEVYLNAC